MACRMRACVQIQNFDFTAFIQLDNILMVDQASNIYRIIDISLFDAILHHDSKAKSRRQTHTATCPLKHLHGRPCYVGSFKLEDYQPSDSSLTSVSTPRPNNPWVL